MMNGILMTHGFDAVSVPAVRAVEFNDRMVEFYRTRDGTEMMEFIMDCAPDGRPAPDSGPEAEDPVPD